jgi:hypothetical protein
MGVGATGGHLLLMAKRRGADFQNTLMIGRQQHYMNKPFVRNLFESHGQAILDVDIDFILENEYSENLLRFMGASSVDSLDASDYEEATITHDMNFPIADHLKQKHTLVIDFGTLEHIFNAPIALKNSIDLLKIDGFYICCVPCNNFMGHGFYQFSPEFFYNFLSKNGFREIEVFLSLYSDPMVFFRTTDPRVFGGRIELVNDETVMINVIAKKAAYLSEIVFPIQSDYHDEIWQGRHPLRTAYTSSAPPVDPKLWEAMKIMKHLTATMSKWPITVARSLATGFENHLQYQLIDPTKD